MMAITMKAARVNANMTQKEAAGHLGISKGTLSNYEKYKTIPDVAMSQKMAALYGLTVNDIIFLGNSCA